MMSRIKSLLTIDHEKLDVRMAVYAVIAIPLAAALGSIIGADVLQAGIAAVLVALVSRNGDLRSKIVKMGVVTLIGGAFGFVAYVSAETAWQAALVLGIVSYVTGLAYGLGRDIGRIGYLLILWTLAVLIGEVHGGDAPGTAVAFLVGGISAIIIVSAATIFLRGREGSDASVSEPDPHASADLSVASVQSLIHSSLGVWSLIRALLTVIAVIIGYQLTDNLDPFWAAIVLLIVFQPDLEGTTFKAMQRGFGTLVGALVATAILESVNSDVTVLVLTLIATFGAITFYSANYMIYTFCLSNAVLLYYWLAVDHEVSGPSIRIIATIIGIVLAVGGVVLVESRTRKTDRGEPGPKPA